MDSIKNALSGGSSSNKNQQTAATNTSNQSSGGGLSDKFNNALGGGQKGEKNEDALDKGMHENQQIIIFVKINSNNSASHYVGVDFVQERVFGQGPQNNESALEQAKDEQISDCEFRNRYCNSLDENHEHHG